MLCGRVAKPKSIFEIEGADEVAIEVTTTAHNLLDY
jgi:hypothetical protein